MSEKNRRSHGDYYAQFFSPDEDRIIEETLIAQGLDPDRVELDATDQDLVDWATLQAFTARYNVRYASATKAEREYVEEIENHPFPHARKKEQNRRKKGKDE